MSSYASKFDLEFDFWDTTAGLFWLIQCQTQLGLNKWESPSRIRIKGLETWFIYFELKTSLFSVSTNLIEQMIEL